MLIQVFCVFQKTPGHMISFLCVNVTGADVNTTKVAYAALFQALKVTLKKPVDHDVTVKVVAKQHSY
jgi:hypothetical protein